MCAFTVSAIYQIEHSAKVDFFSYSLYFSAPLVVVFFQQLMEKLSRSNYGFDFFQKSYKLSSTLYPCKVDYIFTVLSPEQSPLLQTKILRSGSLFSCHFIFLHHGFSSHVLVGKLASQVLFYLLHVLTLNQFFCVSTLYRCSSLWFPLTLYLSLTNMFLRL